MSRNIIERHTIDGKVAVIPALLELEARFKTIQELLGELKEALSGYAVYMEQLDIRLKKIEPQGIIGAEEAKKIILTGK